MADVLSQKQIDELLNSFNTQGSKAFEEIEEQSSEKKVKNYDFKTPKKFTKEQLKVIDSIFENYSRVLSSYLTGMMRLYCKVEVMQIEEQRYYEFNNALPDYVMMSLVNMGVHDEDVMETNCIMQISNPITFTIIDRLMGGLGTYTEVNRDFTEIEITLMQGIMEKMAQSLKNAWSQYIDLDPIMTAIETNSRVMQSIPPDEVIILVSLEIEIKDIKNIMSFCIPAMNLESIMNKFGDRWARPTQRQDPKKDQERRRNIMSALSDSDIDVKAVLCDTQVDLYDIQNPEEGSIFLLTSNVFFNEDADAESGGANRKFFVEITKQLTGSQSSVWVEGKNVGAQVALYPSSMQKVLKVLTMIIIPILILCIGMIVLLLRHKNFSIYALKKEDKKENEE